MLAYKQISLQKKVVLYIYPKNVIKITNSNSRSPPKAMVNEDKQYTAIFGYQF